MFICKNCNNLFVNPEIHYGEILEYLGTPCREESYVCPHCGDGWYGDTSKCYECGEYIVSDYIELKSGKKVCGDCFIGREN